MDKGNRTERDNGNGQLFTFFKIFLEGEKFLISTTQKFVFLGVIGTFVSVEWQLCGTVVSAPRI